MNRQLFATTLAAFAIVTTAPSSYSAENDLAAIKAEITKRHDEAVTRLQDWIKQVSIAAERAATTLVLSHRRPQMRRRTLDELASLSYSRCSAMAATSSSKASPEVWSSCAMRRGRKSALEPVCAKVFASVSAVDRSPVFSFEL